MTTPRTPRTTGAEDYPSTILELSKTYNLGLRISEEPLSPAKRQRDGRFDDLIYQRLRVHFHSGSLAEVLGEFRHRAVEASTRWVKKLRGERDVTVPVTGTPKAGNERERRELCDLLQRILDEKPPRHVAKPFLLSQTRTEPLSVPPLCIPATPLRPLSRSLSALASSSAVPISESIFQGHHDPPSLFSSQPEPQRERGSSRSKRPSGESRFDRPQHPFKRAKSQTSKTSTSRGIYEQSSSSGSRETFVSANDGVFSPTPPCSQETQVTVETVLSGCRRDPIEIMDDATTESYSITPSARNFLLESTGNAISQAQKKPQTIGLDSNVVDSPSHHSYSHFSEKQEMLRLDPPFAALENPTTKRPTTAQSLDMRLAAVWPHKIPPGLEDAPFAVHWEILRACLEVGVDFCTLDIKYSESWAHIDALWKSLNHHAQFRGKHFPDKPRQEAWSAAMRGFQADASRLVTLSASLDFETSAQGPLFQLRLRPLSLDLPHRLSRRFGSDRFLELLVPVLDEKDLTPSLRNSGARSVNLIQDWILQGAHSFLGRTWTPFFVRPDRQKAKKKPGKSDVVGSEPPKETMKNRMYLVAENGDGFRLPPKMGHPSPAGEPIQARTKMDRHELVKWLLATSNEQNKKQPYLKLFSRIVLGLSRTHPTIVLKKHQILPRKHDLLSPTGKVMNDGIGRISRALADIVRLKLGLSEIPAGFQGRIGSAKGFWICDSADNSSGEWIETYPSQRKWICDVNDAEHRTFEVKDYSRQLKSASLNNQFLPILEERAENRDKMKADIGETLSQALRAEIKEQKDAMRNVVHFRLWQDRNAGCHLNGRPDGQIPWIGGLPKIDEDRIPFLLDAGFEPLEQKFLWDLTYKVRKEMCEELKRNLHIRVGRSTWAYIVVDFSGTLQDDEVHLAFSTKFSDDASGFSETFLHNIDVLVGRSPAHYTSDIQKVKAVFKPELGHLKDVVVFPRRGDTALADKLSGGDYDGDKAWVCWDPAIVGNFRNADVPSGPDLLREGIFSKDSTTYRDLQKRNNNDKSVFFEESLKFGLQPTILGICTNFKEKLCYWRGNLEDEVAIYLSTLLSNLVDQPKQGISFTRQHWAKVREKKFGRAVEPPPPLYKRDMWEGRGPPEQICDFLKFSVLDPIVNEELAAFSKHTTSGERQIQFWDRDLAVEYNSLANCSSKSAKKILDELNRDLDAICKNWCRRAGEKTFSETVVRTFEEYQRIHPPASLKTIGQFLFTPGREKSGFTQWDKLKASTLFKLHYNRHPNFVWYMAGRQLALLKAESRNSDAISAPLTIVRPEIYAALKPDRKLVRAIQNQQDVGLDPTGTDAALEQSDIETEYDD